MPCPLPVCPSSDALDKFEPAVLDNTGGSWSGSWGYSIHPTAKRFESYEMSFAAKVGLGVAVQECVELGIQRIWARVQQLAQQLRQGLAALPGVTVHDHGRTLCGLVSFTVDGMTGEAAGRGRGGACADVGSYVSVYAPLEQAA